MKSQEAETKSCFGFWLEATSLACSSCGAQRRCKAIYLTHGSDILADLVEHLKENLPNAQFTDTDRVSTLIQQLRNPTPPPSNALDDEARAVGVLGPPESVPDIDI